MKMGVQAYSSSYFPQRHEEETSMDPTTTCCPNMACPARGQTGQGNIGIHSCKEKRFICTACRKTFSATKGTAHIPPNLVVVPRASHNTLDLSMGCPHHVFSTPMASE